MTPQRWGTVAATGDIAAKKGNVPVNDGQLSRKAKPLTRRIARPDYMVAGLLMYDSLLFQTRAIWVAR